MRRRIRGDAPRGSVLVEFVIVLPIFVLMLLGAIDWGWYFVLRETAVNATREGARVGSVAPDPGAAVTDASLAVRTYLANSLGPSHVRTPEVTLETVGSHQSVSVRLVDYPAGSITGFAATRVPTTLTASTVMRLEVQP